MANSQSSAPAWLPTPARLPHSAPLPNGTFLVGKGHGKHAGGPSSRPTVQPIQALADAAVASGSAPPGGRAAYVFALFGACDDLHRANLLAALGVLARTKPRHAVRVMLDGACRDDAALSRQIVARGAAPLPLAPAPSARCRGIKYAPGSLKHGKGAGYFDATYTKLRVWNLTAYDVALSLDSDVAVLQNLDHVLDGFLAARREVREVRTPQGCLAEGAVSPFLNTGVWAVRPSAPLYARLEAFLERGTVKCGVGDQTAAMSFFGGNRARERIASLHAGYNLKADSGVERCLLQVAQRRGGAAAANASAAAPPRTYAADAHIVHWSGRRKPHDLDDCSPGGRIRDATERRALDLYLTEFCRWAPEPMQLPACRARIRVGMGEPRCPPNLRGRRRDNASAPAAAQVAGAAAPPPKPVETSRCSVLPDPQGLCSKN